MADIQGTLEDGTFYLRKFCDYEDTEDKVEFEELMDDPEAPVHEVDYYEEYVEVLLRPIW